MNIFKSSGKLFLSLFVLLLICSYSFSATLVQENQESAEGKIIQEIRFEGLKRTKEFIVTRELASAVGDPFKQKNVDKEIQRWERLDIFSDIQFETEIDEGKVILTYVFVETFPILPSIGLKISDENGVSVGGGIKTPNLKGKDIYFSGRILFGGSREIEVQLENPWFMGNRIGYSLEYYNRIRDNLITESRETANEVYLRVGGRIGEAGRIGGSLESINIKSDKPGTPLSADGIDYTTRLGAYIGVDSRDAALDTHSGWWNELHIAGDVRIFKNSTKFVQLDLDIRRYQPLPFWDRHTLAIFSLMTLRTGTVGEEVAPWQVFGIGGTNTVRGWEFAARKGKNQFINAVEYRITLAKPRLVNLPFKIKYRGGLQLAFFGDLGIGWYTKDEFRSENFIGGVGAGIRLMVPIVGLVRIDFGYGQPGASIRIHLGAFEKPVMTRKRVR
ncbi:MAG: BamA/TamA family outer membrane protein [Candidatus Aminicenantes bacterium]|nr:BamA/TamA family outer membrane protein [Candidatus Aminicenantes bacterium]